MADINEKLKALEVLFGDGLEDIPTTGIASLKVDVFDALKTIFGVRDVDLTLDNYKRTTKGDGSKGPTKAEIIAEAQAPYLALAHLMVVLAKGAEIE